MSTSTRATTTKSGKPMDFPIASLRLRMAQAILTEEKLRQLRPKLSREAVCEMYPLSRHDLGGLEAYYEVEIVKRAAPTRAGDTEALWLIFEPRIRRMIQDSYIGMSDTNE